MNVRTKILSVSLFLLLSPMVVLAQKQWTLEDCIKYAWENNLSVKQQSLAVEQSKNKVEQSKWDLAPNVSASAGYNFNWGRSVNVQDLTVTENKLAQSANFSINTNLDLFAGMQKLNTIKSNEAQLNISIQEVERLKNDISIEISRVFLQVILAKEILATAQLSYQSVSEQVERSRKLVSAGSLPQSSLLEIEAQLATEKVQTVSAENTVRTNLLTLSQLLDLSNQTDFQIGYPSIELREQVFMGASVGELYDISQSLPRIQSAVYSVEQKKHQLSITKGQRYPSLSLSAGYSTYYSSKENSDGSKTPFFTQLDDSRNPSVGLSLRIPIFSNRSIVTNIRNADIAVQMAELDMRSKQQLLYKEIQQANNDALSSFQRYQATGQNVKAMTESFRYVQQKFDVGMLNGTDYVVAKNNLFRAQSDQLQAKFQYVFQLKILDFYEGIPITL